MAIKTKFDQLILEEDRLFLSLKKRKNTTVYFSEIGKAYIKVNKMQPIQMYLVSIPLFFIAFILVSYLKAGLIPILAVIPVVPVYLKMKTYRSLSFIIELKNGTVFRKKIPIKRKDDYRAMVSQLRKEMLNWTSNTMKKQNIYEAVSYPKAIRNRRFTTASKVLFS